MRVALVHDWLVAMRGGERVLEEIAGLFPDADLYTLFHVPGATSARIDALRVRESALGRVPGARRHHRLLLPLLPWAISRFRLEGYDLVLSTHHAVAKGVGIAPGTPHLCYCFTPMRYVFDQADAYLGRGLLRIAASPLVEALRRFEVRTSGPSQVTRYAAVSRHVAERIRRHYGRSATVLHPPVRLDRFQPSGRPPEDFYLQVGGFVPYKREDVALEAFRRLGRRLVVVGDGPGRAGLERRAPGNVEFTGRISDLELAELYSRCRALVFTADEDFGLVPVEAQASGRPVIAYAAGGATETVVSGRTGVFFPRQDAESLVRAVEAFEAREAEFDAGSIRRHAERFDGKRFGEALLAEVERTLRVRSGDRAQLDSASQPPR